MICRILGAGKYAAPVDVALMKLVPSLNAFSNDELSADLLSQRLLRALLIKDIAMQTGMSKNTISIQDIAGALYPPPLSPKRTSPQGLKSLEEDSENGCSPPVVPKKSVSFSSFPQVSSSPTVSNLTLPSVMTTNTNQPPMMPGSSSSKRTVIFAQEYRCHREEIFVFSASDAPMATSPPVTSSSILSSSPSFAASSRLSSYMPSSPSTITASSRSVLASSPSSSYLSTLPTSSSPVVEVYHVNEIVSSHMKPFSSQLKEEVTAVAESSETEEKIAILEELNGWRAEGSARVVIDRSKRSIVIEQYTCRFYSSSTNP